MADIDRIIEHYHGRDRVISMFAGIGIVLGVILLVLGISGSITLQAEANNVSGKLINGSPGVVVAVLGFVVLGMQAWQRPRIRILHSQDRIDIELHENGPVFLLSGDLGIYLNRPFDRDSRGDHWYGEPIDSMIDKLTTSPLNREDQSPRTTIRYIDSARIEQTIDSLIEAWSRSASIQGQSDRTVIVNIGGKWKGYEFKGGHTYMGKLAKEQIGFVLYALGVLAQRESMGVDT